MTRLTFEYYLTFVLFIVSLCFIAIQSRAWAFMATMLGISFIMLKIYRNRLGVHQRRMAQIDLRKAIALLQSGDYNQAPKIIELIASLWLPVKDVEMALKILENAAATVPVEFLNAYRRALEGYYGESERPLCKYYDRNQYIRCALHPDFKTCEGCKDYAEP